MTFPKRKKRERMMPPKDDRVRCESHLQWVRGMECAISDQHECTGRIEAHHVHTARDGRRTDGARGRKPSDTWSVPLCSGSHAELHTGGEITFQNKYAIDLYDFALLLARRSPHRGKWEMSVSEGENDG